MTTREPISDIKKQNMGALAKGMLGGLWRATAAVLVQGRILRRACEWVLFRHVKDRLRNNMGFRSEPENLNRFETLCVKGFETAEAHVWISFSWGRAKGAWAKRGGGAPPREGAA